MRLGYLMCIGCTLVSVVLGQVPAPASRPTTLPTSAPTETFPYFGRVAGKNVRVRGGPGDFHSEVMRLNSPDVVKVVGRKGDWYQIEVPGGLPLWVKTRQGANEYLRMEKPGEGIVTVNDLQLRGTASTDEPPVGELKAGERLVVLDTKDEWAHVLMPPSHPGFVHNTLIKRVMDGGAIATEFRDRDAAARADAVRQGELSAKAAEQEAKEKARREKFRAALEKFETERKKDVLDRDITGTKAVLDDVIASTPDADDPQRALATATLGRVKDWEQNAEVTRKARAAIAEADRRAKESQITYQKDLEELRKRKEAEAAQRDKKLWPYLAAGYVRLAPPIPGAPGTTPKYAIYKGSQREYYLTSSRYDLADFEGKLVGILEWDSPESSPGNTFRVANVKKMEVLPAGTE